MSESTRQAFGKRVRGLRQEREISLRRFALMIGRDKGFLLDVEYGRKSPSLDTIEKIAAGFGMTISDLCQDIDTPPQDKNSSTAEHFGYQSVSLPRKH